uniref:Uncharacterized protein n=1 Tax=Mustela putorius furo TaxID=9669 RepID=M3XMX5_MUSPF
MGQWHMCMSPGGTCNLHVHGLIAHNIHGTPRTKNYSGSMIYGSSVKIKASTNLGETLSIVVAQIPRLMELPPPQTPAPVSEERLLWKVFFW